MLKPKGEKFLKGSGFTKRYRLEQEKPVEVGGTLAKLQQQNMKLQNLKLSAESERDAYKKTVQLLLFQRYAWWALIAIAFIIGYWLGHHGRR